MLKIPKRRQSGPKKVVFAKQIPSKRKVSFMTNHGNLGGEQIEIKDNKMVKKPYNPANVVSQSEEPAMSLATHSLL
jgi:hypothetical protein